MTDVPEFLYLFVNQPLLIALPLLGFVALAQIQEAGQIKGGSHWVVPATLHAPIVQDAVILKRAAGNPAAQAWMELLRSPKVRQQLVRGYGYDVQ